MASRTFSRAIRSQLTRQLASPAVQQRTLAAAGRSLARQARPAMVGPAQQQVRGVKTMDFAGSKEDVYERADWPQEKLLDYFKNDTLALIGYGSQGHGQGLNLRDNGLNVIIGVRKDGKSWKDAIQDGWVPGKNLFEVDEAISRGSIIMNLLSDAAQSETWPHIKPQITKGKTLYFSHGFSPVFKERTNVEVPTDVDVILVAPKGSGRTVRSLFREGRGINSSFAVFQDVTGKAEERAIALGVAIGSGYLYKTTFEKEVYSDLYGERGCLMGGIHGMFLAQYEVLRERGHSPSEAFNETVEEATQSLYPLIGANGMDWMDGTETQRSLDYNGQKDYRQKFEAEMEEIRNMEIWRAGKAVRSLRPENQNRTLDEFASRQQTEAELQGTPWEGQGPGVRPTAWVGAGGRQRGVATHSSGNHAQALALAARENGIPAHVVMPSVSNPTKVAATAGYGAVLYESGSAAPERQKMLDSVVGRTGATFVPPYDHPDIILGQGTAGLELQEQAAELIAEHAAKTPGGKARTGLDAIITPCGGGGLLSGTALSCEGTGISVFAGEPSHQGADDLVRAIRANLDGPISDVRTLTIADGLRTPVGLIPWSIIRGDRRLVRDAFAVSERDISRALRFVLERLKVVVEPSAVVPLAVVLFNEDFRKLVEEEGGEDGWDVGVIFTGNLSLDALPELLKIGDEKA
ncbi:unnamed protein product [Parascedosporium putredinis]|uniref:Acetohydroxy-acid reductoisomerase n=1 Tax=Parascedosporium putredinis TaxID=1442378 RepID=A0A9P1MBB4_9PEZI|nr:unnamed protein product [Parascedosporium putredinis]CAI7995616.1 unnamed protein product [Parascedosporium putredinis]